LHFLAIFTHFFAISCTFSHFLAHLIDFLFTQFNYFLPILPNAPLQKSRNLHPICLFFDCIFHKNT